MKPVIKYQWYLLFLLAAVSFAACSKKKKEKRIDPRVTLFRADKLPYGTWYAYNNLSHIFRLAEIEVNRKQISTYVPAADTDKKMLLDGSRTEAYVIICKSFMPSDAELATLQNFIGNGGHVFISANHFSDAVLDTMHLNATGNNEIWMGGATGVKIEHPVENETDSFYYPGFPLSGYFSKIDSSITTILGHNSEGNPNYVKFDYESGGSLQLHVAPLALSNFFLLHKQNQKYYDEVMSYLPDNITKIYWDDYFRSKRRTPDEKFSAFRWLQKQPGLAMALWLILLLAAIVYLFESKRRQRLIPVRKPLKNATVEFARTVGQLYLQRKDNNNLAHKMAAIFTDRVRRQFNVRTTMDEEFITKLAHKSGYDRAALHNLVYQLKYAQAHPDVSDLELLQLQKQLDHFYQNT